MLRENKELCGHKWGSFRKRDHFKSAGWNSSPCSCLSIHGQCHSPSPVKCTPTLFSWNSGVFWHKGCERKLFFALWGTPHKSCLPCLWGLLTCLLHFTSTDLSATFTGYSTWPLTFQLASSHQDQMYSAHLYSNGSKGISLEILNKEAFVLTATESFLPGSGCLSKEK